MMPGMIVCAKCDNRATIPQTDGAFCPDHATDRAALHARLHAVESATLPDDPAERDRALAEEDAIEYRLGELEAR